MNIKDDIAPAYPAPPLCLVGEAAALGPHRFRGVRRLRLPHQARREGQGFGRPHHAIMTYREYVERWDELAGIFSREASSKARSTSSPIHRTSEAGHGEVDAAFLEEIEAGADCWPSNLALRNPNLARARSELRRAEHHRPHHLPAHRRGPRHRGLRPAPSPAQRYSESTPACRALRAKPTTATTPACSTSQGERTATSRPTISRRPDDRRQGAEGHHSRPLLPRTALRVLGAARATFSARSTSSSSAR